MKKLKAWMAWTAALCLHTPGVQSILVSYHFNGTDIGAGCLLLNDNQP